MLTAVGAQSTACRLLLARQTFWRQVCRCRNPWRPWARACMSLCRLNLCRVQVQETLVFPAQPKLSPNGYIGDPIEFIGLRVCQAEMFTISDTRGGSPRAHSGVQEASGPSIRRRHADSLSIRSNNAPG